MVFRKFKFDIPIKGYSEGVNVIETPTSMSGDMGNVRPIDSLEKKLRIGQRNGMKKEFSTQIAGTASPVVYLGSITVIDYLGA